MSTECTADKPPSMILEHVLAQLVALSSLGTNVARFELPLAAEATTINHFRQLAKTYKQEGLLGAFFLLSLARDLRDDEVYGPVFKDSMCDASVGHIASMLRDCTRRCERLMRDDFGGSEGIESARDRGLAILDKFITIGRESGDLAIALAELCNKPQSSESTDTVTQPVTVKPIQQKERTTSMTSLLGQCCLSEPEDKHPVKTTTENALALYKALVRAAALYDVIRAVTTAPNFNASTLDSLDSEIKLLLQYAVSDVSSCSLEGINHPFGSITWSMKTAASLWQVLQFEAQYLAAPDKEADISVRTADVNKYLRIAQQECTELAMKIETQYHDKIEFSSFPSIKR